MVRSASGASLYRHRPQRQRRGKPNGARTHSPPAVQLRGIATRRRRTAGADACPV